ncbi:allatostatin-A receptor-like [Saccostrea echinata]|uniref:allatostatin-A receptor-like n=1 Tax=Saccostrea echinata TaxID=191078 RepID=UPI002A808D96|nr:allatostatin-A receptor-like [Saccostrea echinata]
MMENTTCDNETICKHQEHINIDKFLEFENIIQYLIPVIFGLIAVFGVLGNAFVVSVIMSKEKLQNTTNILIVNLAIADLFFIVFCVPFTAASYSMAYWPFGDVLCKLVNFISYVCAYASIWTMVLLSFDRNIAVVHPVLSKQIRNRRNTFLLLFFIWTLIFGGNIPVLLQYSVVYYQWIEHERSTCMNLVGLRNKYALRVFYGCFFVFGYALPLTLICILYGCILKRLQNRSVATWRQRRRSFYTQRRVTRIIITFVMAFALCWLPIQVIFLIESFTNYEQTIESAAGLMTANCLAYVNSCINPIIYAFLSVNFPKKFRIIASCLPAFSRRKKRVNPRKQTQDALRLRLYTKEIQDLQEVAMNEGKMSLGSNACSERKNKKNSSVMSQK